MFLMWHPRNKTSDPARHGAGRGGSTDVAGCQLVVDEFTRAAYGEIIVHAVLLSNFQITRKAQFHKQQVQTA